MKKIVSLTICLALLFTKGSTQKNPSLITYSKFDFIAGEKILSYEDFSRAAVGDFPVRWNTNAGGEVVTVDGQEGHWLLINKKGRFIPEPITSLPENFTLQFDLIANENFSYYSSHLQLLFITGGSGRDALDYNPYLSAKRSGVKIGLLPTSPGLTNGEATIQTFEDNQPGISNEITTTNFNSSNGKAMVTVSVWRQNQRLRVYLNEEKIMDIPQAFAAGKSYRTVMFELESDMFNKEDRYLISNLKLAVGAPDTRNKLITEGKFVTRGILFDVNSDQVKAQSYGTLKDIAAVLSENPTVKVLIVGHTDADGSETDNLALSKRRAESVKKALSNEFKIDASRMTTDGKGESQPVDSNNTPEGKANNRRVEFIKQS